MIQEKIEELKGKILNLAMLAENMLDKTKSAVYTNDHLLANSVITDMEQLVNRLEMENENRCIEYLALFQPEAADLRTIISFLKINNNIERIADHAVNIAQRIGSFESIKEFKEIKIMFELSQGMLRQSFDSLAMCDMVKARGVCRVDAEVDKSLEVLTDNVLMDLARNPDIVNNALSALLIGRDLERIADLSTNISEDIIYMLSGKLIKHSCNINSG